MPEIAAHANNRQPGMLWQWILELAFAARVWLLQEEQTSSGPPPIVLREFSRGRIDVQRRGPALLDLWTQEDWRRWARQEARRLLRARETARRSRARTLASETTRRRSDEQASAADSSDGEVTFLAGALRHCREHQAEHYARVLYQYLRVKVALYGNLVVDPWTTGLRHFLDVVRRDGPYADVIDD